MDVNQSSPPIGTWAEGRRLRASAWSGSPSRSPDLLCRTLTAPGDFSPDAPQPAWSFHLALPQTMRNPEAVHLANGYALEFPNTAGVPRIVCLTHDDGAFAGWGSWVLRPSLFSPTAAVETDGREQWIRLPDTTVLLSTTQTDEETRFALVHGPGPDSDLRAKAAGLLELDIHEAWEREIALRSRFWPRCTGDHQTMAAHALETMVLHLEPPEDGQPHRCSSTTLPNHPHPCVNQIFPLVLAWLDVDPDVAADLLMGLLTRVAPDGRVILGPGSAVGSQIEPWPFLARAASRVAAHSQQDPAFGESVAPRLLRYLQRTLQRLDPDRSGLACWPSEPEAWIRPAFDKDLATPALSGLLLAEIDSLLGFAPPGLVEQTEIHEALRQDQARLADALERTLWDRDDSIYRSRYLNGNPVGRTTLAGLIPLAWSGLPADRRVALAMHLEPGQAFGHEAGAPLWQAWDQDPQPAPIPAFHQIALLDALNHPETQSHYSAFKQRILQSLLKLDAGNPAWPVDLLDGRESAPQGSWAHRGYEAPVVAACLAILVSPSPLAEQETAVQASPFWQALDRRRTSVLVTAILVLFAGVATSALLQLRLPGELQEDDGFSISTESRALARQLIRQGQYEEAMDLLESISDSKDGAAELGFLRANIHFRIGDFALAEAGYRSLLDHETLGPAATLNLALTLLRQNRIDEATTLYQQCAEEFETSEPRVAARAASAASFLRNHAATLTTHLSDSPE